MWAWAQTGGILSRVSRPGNAPWADRIGSSSESIANGGGDLFGLAAHHFFRFSFDHHTRQRLSAGVADDDAAVSVKRFFRFADAGGDCVDLVQRFLFLYANVHDDLRKDLEVGDEFVKRLARAAHDIENDERGEQAIAGGGQVRKENMS